MDARKSRRHTSTQRRPGHDGRLGPGAPLGGRQDLDGPTLRRVCEVRPSAAPTRDPVVLLSAGRSGSRGRRWVLGGRPDGVTVGVVGTVFQCAARPATCFGVRPPADTLFLSLYPLLTESDLHRSATVNPYTTIVRRHPQKVGDVRRCLRRRTGCTHLHGPVTSGVVRRYLLISSFVFVRVGPGEL